MIELATLGGGCFWCIEVLFQRLKGVEKVESGYAGGNIDNPSYEAISSGNSGHAEVIQLSYNPEIISYRELIEIFFTVHDPTTLNRQGNDKGTQYRSAIFYHDENQNIIAQKVMDDIGSKGIWDNPIVTEITCLDKFYLAEKYHQNYYNDNSNQPYCQFVIAPKVAKFKKMYLDKLIEKID
jgi:peptide-methionine (S)-S-oxide reductase